MGKQSLIRKAVSLGIVGSVFSFGCGTSLETLCNPLQEPEPLPEGYISCPAVYEPVCGDDGKTYSNSCEAGLNREVMSYKPGACE